MKTYFDITKKIKMTELKYIFISYKFLFLHHFSNHSHGILKGSGSIKNLFSIG